MLRKVRMSKFLLGIKYFPPLYHTSTIPFHAATQELITTCGTASDKIFRKGAREISLRTLLHTKRRVHFALGISLFGSLFAIPR